MDEMNWWIKPEDRPKAVEKATQLLEKFLETPKPSVDTGWPEVTVEEWRALQELFHAILDAKYEYDVDGDSVIRFVLVNRNVHEHFCYTPVMYGDQPDMEGHIISDKLLNFRLAIHDVERYMDEKLRETDYWQKPGEIKDENDQDQSE